jgi:hypothetical protein
VKHPALLARVERRLVRAVWAWQRRCAKRLGMTGKLHGGGVGFRQYFGSALYPRVVRTATGAGCLIGAWLFATVSGCASTPRAASDAASEAPPPGAEATERPLPERLTSADLWAVVLADRPAMQQCVAEHRKREPEKTARVILSWEIEPDGRVSKVSLVSEEFAGTYVADCLLGVVATWRFPQHRIRGEPVFFPFLI